MKRPFMLKLWKWVRVLAPWVAIYALMVGLAYLAPVEGSDWVHHFKPRNMVFIPWTEILSIILPDLPFLTGLTLTALAYCMWSRKATAWQMLAAFCALPLFWCVWLGQVDAIPMLGLALLPWGIPLALVKPQATVWYLWVWWRKRKDRWVIVLGTLAFLGLSLVIWGWWPGERKELPLTFFSSYNLSVWRIHWTLGIIFVIGALFETDPERAMALGILASPYVQGNSFFILLPLLTRLKGWPLLAVWVTSWLGVLALFFGDDVRLLAMLFPLSLWLALFLIERKQRKPSALPDSPLPRLEALKG